MVVNYNSLLHFLKLMIIMVVLTTPAVLMTYNFIKKETTERANIRKYIGELWDSLYKRVVYQVIAHHFFAGIFSDISYTASSPVQSYLLGVTPINNMLHDVIGTLVFHEW
ncbi:unnamed protein product [Peronospora farinosa]|uniref:Uncharacterized protein n=1 Tax=Peronospora farinosa TaxID=134698 RepID=A0AAV0SSH9_9STRA|nr:unnamed protein product [Peronospora farinosa]CAI5706776.1 unnamed protein product [Peronospora farinosa]